MSIESFLSEWLPQEAVLRHSSIAMAILHGGKGGFSQYLYNSWLQASDSSLYQLHNIFTEAMAHAKVHYLAGNEGSGRGQPE